MGTHWFIICSYFSFIEHLNCQMVVELNMHIRSPHSSLSPRVGPLQPRIGIVVGYGWMDGWMKDWMDGCLWPQNTNLFHIIPVGSKSVVFRKIDRCGQELFFPIDILETGKQHSLPIIKYTMDALGIYIYNYIHTHSISLELSIDLDVSECNWIMTYDKVPN